MSYPDVVSSSRNQSPQRLVNVMQRSQVSPAALIESEAGIKRGHVNNIASLFGPQQQTSVSRRPSTNRERQQGVARKPSNGHLSGEGPANRSKSSRIAVVPKETSIKASQVQTVSQSRPATVGDSSSQSSSVPRPAPWPKPSVGPSKNSKSFGKSDSDLYASSTEVRASKAAPGNAPGQPTIVINRAKYVPRATRAEEKAGPNSRPKSSEIPSSVKVGRWTVYETLPFGTKENRATENNGAGREAQKKKKDEDEWNRLEALERDRMKEAERRKSEYDRKHREELEAQEVRRQEKVFAEEQRRKRELERAEEERRQRTEEERQRRKEIEEQERRRLEEEEREVARQENERRLREAREKRRFEIQQEEEDQRQRMERRRLAEQDELERRRKDENERRRAEERRREEGTRRREAELQRREIELQRREEEAREREKEKTLNRDPDMHTEEEWTVYDSAPTSQAGVQSIAESQSQPSFNSRYSDSTRNYRSLRKPSGKENSGESDASIESEYMRNLREIEEKQRQQDQEEINQRNRETGRQRMNCQEKESRRRDENNIRYSDSQRLEEGVSQWSALAEMEPLDSGSVVGYRRFLNDEDNTSNRTNKDRVVKDDVRQREEDEARARAQQEAEEVQRRREENNRKQREMEEDQRRREMDNRHRREEEQRLREAEERRLRQVEEERRAHDKEDPWNNRENRFDRWKQHQDRFGVGGDFFTQQEWTTFESAPGQQASVDQSAFYENPSHEDSVVGYRRLLEEADAKPLESDRSRSNDSATRSRVRVTDDGKKGRQRREETLAPPTRRIHSEAISSDEETPRFEEWTEYHSVPSQYQAPNSTDSNGVYRQKHPDLHRQGSYESEMSEDSPKFEEWTVVHRVPASQAEFAAGYDTVDSGAGTSAEEYDDQDPNRSSTAGSKHRFTSKRRFQSTDSLNQDGSNEDALPVEEIMPRRRGSGRRQRNAIVAAALRHLESAPTSRVVDAADRDASAATDTQTARLSPYHSYQRIHHDHRGRYRDENATAPGGSSNGNVFQDSFNVKRDNPAYYWHD